MQNKMLVRAKKETCFKNTVPNKKIGNKSKDRSVTRWQIDKTRGQRFDSTRCLNEGQDIRQLGHLFCVFIEVVFQDLLEEPFPDGEGQRVGDGRVNFVDGVVAEVKPVK